eukprot:m.24667 g.24667  ORF g.24667 m.24667 type:complete len:1066 (+) comp13425_c0_seq1:186-3383(+)
MTRVGRHTVVVLLVCVLFCDVAQTQSACTKADYHSFLTPCNNGNRDQIFYPAVNCCTDCPGAYQPPPNDYDVPCRCGAGESRKSDGTCVPCEEGYFNPGGIHYDQQDWEKWIAPVSTAQVQYPAPGVVTMCQGSGCNLWTPSDNFESVNSGNNSEARNSDSSLIITKEFEGDDNSVSFQYRVDAEQCTYTPCDGLIFSIDSKPVSLGGKFVVKSKQEQFVYFTHSNISKGIHSFAWSYVKDGGLSDGEDRAFLKSITLIGAVPDAGITSENCEPCPSGTFTNKTAQSLCTPCDWFTFQPNQHSTSCEPCNVGEIAIPGSSQCVTQRNCTDEDYFTLKSPISSCTQANDYMYDEAAQWMQVQHGGILTPVCNTKAFPLPASKKNVGKCTCPKGHFLDTSSATTKCSVCPAGTYNDGTMDKCEGCADDTFPLQGIVYEEWNEPLQTQAVDESETCPGDGPCTSCAGDCIHDGWIAAGDHLSSGRTFGDVEVRYVYPDLQVVPGTVLTVQCSIDCRQKNGELAPSSQCSLTFAVYNSTADRMFEFDCAARNEFKRDGRKLDPISITAPDPGDFTLIATFHQEEKTKTFTYEARLYLLAASPTPQGHGLACSRCPAGHKFIKSSLSCERCPAGYQSTTPVSSTCERCPSDSFSPTAGSMCLKCGEGTVPTADQTGCDYNGCSFVGQVSGKSYDLSRLGHDGGDMVFAGQDVSSYLGFAHEYWLNPCYTDHTNTSCVDMEGNPLPYMACQTNGQRAFNLGSVLSFHEEQEGELQLRFTQGEMCGPHGPRNTTVHLSCSLDAEEGPGRMPDAWYIERLGKTCLYDMYWPTKHACPICTPDDYQAYVSLCRGFTQTVTYEPKVNCSGVRPSSTIPCFPPKPTDRPASSQEVYFVVTVQVTAEIRSETYPARAAELLPSFVYANNVTVIRMEAGTLIFRIVTFANNTGAEEKIKKDLEERFTDPDFLGKYQSYTLLTASGSSSSSVNMPAVIAVVVILVVLLAVLGFFIYRNRQLKYENYQLVQLQGQGESSGAQLYDDEDDLPDFTTTSKVVYHNEPPPKDNGEDDDFDPRL